MLIPPPYHEKTHPLYYKVFFHMPHTMRNSTITMKELLTKEKNENKKPILTIDSPIKISRLAPSIASRDQNGSATASVHIEKPSSASESNEQLSNSAKQPRVRLPNGLRIGNSSRNSSFLLDICK